MVRGGSGVKDDVPADLMGGEYVIRKSAVQKIGIDKLNELNRVGFASGGAVSEKLARERKIGVAIFKPEGDFKSATLGPFKYKGKNIFDLSYDEVRSELEAVGQVLEFRKP